MSAGGIFVSYRRDDTRQAAGRLADALADRFGAKRLFRDIETIELGVDFGVALHQALASCAVMLVLIGDKWLNIQNAAGQRRLEDPSDWIRQEISVALQRGIRVVPVLVDGAQLPAEADLPEELRPLVRRQAIDLADGRWKGDVQRLCDTLDRMPELQRTIGPIPKPAPASSLSPPASPPTSPPPSPPPPAKNKTKMWAGIAAGVLGLSIVSSLLNKPDEPQQLPDSSRGQMASVPNLAGMWRTRGGEVYQFSQRGTQLQFSVWANNQQVGAGTGTIDGSMLHIGMSLALPRLPAGNWSCELQAATPDFQSFSGVCAGPSGQLPGLIFR